MSTGRDAIRRRRLLVAALFLALGVGSPHYPGLGFQFMRALANGLNAELQFEHDSLGVCARLVKPRHLAS